MGNLLAESRAAHCKAIDLDADETRVIWFGQYVFFGWMRNLMNR